MARLRGHRLKFDETDPQQGIFFIAEDGTETKVDPLDVGQNTPSLLVFGVPPTLSPGSYQLAVRALFGTQSLRTGILPKPLLIK